MLILRSVKLLLLIQSQDDVDHLSSAAKAVKNSAINGVWCVFSPAITVNASEAAAKLDSEIEQLRTAERQAAERSDYTAAAGYKTQREGKELDRAKALRDAWKTASEEDRKARTKAIFEPFIKALNPDGKGSISVRVTSHSDHYEREQWVAMINSLSGVWFKPFTPGSFVVGWPESVETSIKGGTAAPVAAKVAHPVEAAVALTREQELAAMHHMSLKPIAKKLGIETQGMGKEEMVAAIIAAESKQPEPALAEY